MHCGAGVGRIGSPLTLTLVNAPARGISRAQVLLENVILRFKWPGGGL